MNKRELRKEYKERVLTGGVYKITNTVNGKYLLGHAVNLAGVRNHFQFAIATGSTIHPKVKEDWEALGSQSFDLDVLEELEQKPEQTAVEFRDDLAILEHLWQAQLNPAKAY